MRVFSSNYHFLLHISVTNGALTKHCGRRTKTSLDDLTSSLVIISLLLFWIISQVTPAHLIKSQSRKLTGEQPRTPNPHFTRQNSSFSYIQRALTEVRWICISASNGTLLLKLTEQLFAKLYNVWHQHAASTTVRMGTARPKWNENQKNRWKSRMGITLCFNKERLRVRFCHPCWSWILYSMGSPKDLNGTSWGVKLSLRKRSRVWLQDKWTKKVTNDYSSHFLWRVNSFDCSEHFIMEFYQPKSGQFILKLPETLTVHQKVINWATEHIHFLSSSCLKPFLLSLSALSLFSCICYTVLVNKVHNTFSSCSQIFLF